MFFCPPIAPLLLETVQIFVCGDFQVCMFCSDYLLEDKLSCVFLLASCLVGNIKEWRSAFDENLFLM
jgi:hypothetical protein